MEHDSQAFYLLLWLYTIILQSHSASSASYFTMFLWPLNRIFWITQFHSIYNRSYSLSSFLNTSLFFSIFSLCVIWNSFFVSIFLPLYHSFIQGLFVPPSFENFPLFCSLTKNQEFFFPHQLRKNHNETDCIWHNKSEHTKFI